MLELCKIEKSYSGTRVLAGASVCCNRGEAVCLAGANAAGKTTLLSIAAGLEQKNAGSVVCDGGVGFIPQESALLEDLSVRDNLRLWYAASKHSKEKPFGEHSAETALGLLPFARKRVGLLSGGMKKRVSICCALTGSPAYLLMDEPFTALDLPGKNDICALLCRLKQAGFGLLFSSHDPTAIAAVADRLLLLRGGVIVRELPLEEDPLARSVQIYEALTKTE